MDATPGPVLRRRQAGIRLRQHREAAGKSLGEVAAYLDCSAAKVSRIETGRLLARIPDVRNMLDFYAVPEPQRTELLDLVKESREKGWWQAYPELAADGFDTFIGLEDSAAQIWQYDSYLVPGLLQTREYAYAVQARRMDMSEETAERYIEVRMTRQAILRRAHPPVLDVVLDESALHRVLALGAAVGQGQIDQLVRLAGQPDIALRVLEYGSGIGASNGTSFIMFGFPDPADPKVVYHEGMDGIAYERRLESVARYSLAFDGIRADALDPDESISFMTELARRHR